jgi:4'-phosphopantetheinyl transferase EntD
MTDTRQKAQAMDNLIAQDADLLDAQPTQSDENSHKLALSESFERVAKVAEERAAFNAGIEAAANALEADAKQCDCFARNEGECGCGAWCEWKSITSARAVEIVRALQEHLK